MSIFTFFGKTQEKEEKPQLVKFFYRYQRYPFDDGQEFSVLATDQESANVLATERYTQMFNKGETIEPNFYPVKTGGENKPKEICEWLRYLSYFFFFASSWVLCSFIFDTLKPLF